MFSIANLLTQVIQEVAESMDQFILQLEPTPSGVYFSGQTVSGFLVVVNNSELSFKGNLTSLNFENEKLFATLCRTVCES